MRVGKEGGGEVESRNDAAETAGMVKKRGRDGKIHKASYSIRYNRPAHARCRIRVGTGAGNGLPEWRARLGFSFMWMAVRVPVCNLVTVLKKKN
jgi:hypothetical protein